MSLKAFHIFFILISILLFFGFAVWLVDSFLRSGNALAIVGAGGAILAGVGLILYGLRFLRKLKNVSYL